jgi:transcriptional regulator with XRE-family HTH domain
MQEWINPLMTNEVTKFGKKLREARLKKKLSQGDMAKILGVHRTYISGLERGRRNPSLLTVQKVAKALNISPKELL